MSTKVFLMNTHKICFPRRNIKKKNTFCKKGTLSGAVLWYSLKYYAKVIPITNGTCLAKVISMNTHKVCFANHFCEVS